MPSPNLRADGSSFVQMRPPRAAVAGALLATAGLGTALQDYAAIDDAAAAGDILARAAAFGGVAVAGLLAALASAGAWRLADRHLPHTLILAAPPSLASIVALEWTRPLLWLAPGFACLGTLFWVGALVFLARRGARLPLTGACWALVFPTTAQAHALHSVGGTFGASWMQ